MEDMSLGQAIWIGACQILSALFPGTHRASMSTNRRRTTSSECSACFRLGVFHSSCLFPTMAAATCYDLLKSTSRWEKARIQLRCANRSTRLDRSGHRLSSCHSIVAYGSVRVVYWRGFAREVFAPFCDLPGSLSVHLLLAFAAKLAA